jgi:hypothetical protein
MNIEKLLRYIITQILNNMNKRALLFITGGSVNIKDIFETLKSFNLLQYDIVVSEDAEKVVPEEYIKNLKGNIISCKADMTKAIKEADLVIIPIMSRNTLSKCAAGISDNLVTLGISEALMMSKEIIAVKDSFDPLNPLNISLGVAKNAMYNKFILEYEERLISFGIKFLDSNDLRKAIQGKFNTLNINVLNNYDINELENKNTIQQHTLRLEEKNYYKNQPIEKVETLTSEKENIHLENYLSSVVQGQGTQKVDNASFDTNSFEDKRVLGGILTIEDIMTAVNVSKEIFIKQESIITPLAKDYIYNNKVDVRYC